jgi:hypothetical protein
MFSTFRTLTTKLMRASATAVILTAVVAGCDSTQDLNDPATKKQFEANQQRLKETEDRANAANAKKGGKNAEPIRSIKGNIKVPDAAK